MPKLYSARIILSALQRAGFSIISQKGSHIKLYKIAIGTFGSILKQAGMNRKELAKFIK